MHNVISIKFSNILAFTSHVAKCLAEIDVKGYSYDLENKIPGSYLNFPRTTKFNILQTFYLLLWRYLAAQAKFSVLS